MSLPNPSRRATATETSPLAAVVPTFVERFLGWRADLHAQRIWVLERPGPRLPHQDVCHYAGGVLLFDDERVYGLVVRSPECARASGVPLREGRVRVDLDRDAFRFASLDDAVRGMDRVKQTFLDRRWVEVDDAESAAGTA